MHVALLQWLEVEDEFGTNISRGLAISPTSLPLGLYEYSVVIIIYSRGPNSYDSQSTINQLPHFWPPMAIR